MWEDALADHRLRHEWGRWGKEKERRGTGQEEEEGELNLREL